MTIKQHIRMTASEIAMGRYMRAPDHDAMTAEFDAAFSAEALKDVAEDKPAIAPAADASPAADPAPADPPAADAPPAADPPVADPPVVDAPSADPPAADASPAADPAPADPPVADPPAAETPAAVAPDADAIINQLAEAIAKQPKPEAPSAAETPADAPPLFSDTETAQLAKFREDWPEEAKAVDLMQRELGVGITRYIFDQIAPEVQQIRDIVQKLALRAHHTDLIDEIGEYPSDQEIDEVKAWVQTQPSYLQTGMNGVIDRGTAEEIGDLVSRYRKETGKKPAGAQAEVQTPPVEAELSDEAKKAALALAPVGSKRSAVQSPEDASDFDAGWAKYKDSEV